VAKGVIAIDVDDVLANSTDAFRKVVNERLNIKLSPDDYRIQADYDRYYEEVWEQNGLGNRVDYADFEPGMVQDQSHIQPHQGALPVLRKLAKTYRLIVVTSRPASWRKATDTWLERYFPDRFDEVFFTDEADGKTKGQLCKEYNAGWLVDDNVDHAQSAVDAGLEVILFGDYGWHHKAPAHFHRCHDWAAVQEYFDGWG
jgi:5'(3')-deoxyribonucleotidase